MVKRLGSAELFARKVDKFIASCNTGKVGEYNMCREGEVTLYSSCFAAMTLHYLNRLSILTTAEKTSWVDYINSWQDQSTGLFLGPEIVTTEMTSEIHGYEHITMHLAAHVLPALALLGAKPSYELKFAHRFLDEHELLKWLEARDWSSAWLEGNNLIFIAQFLIYLRDFEKRAEAVPALALYFNWLDSQLDPATGLWGTNGFCTPFIAMCGGYHQLIAYHAENRKVKHKERLIDTILALQHDDGGFSPEGGGGACEDVDAVDILVNMYKQINYRRPEIRAALRRVIPSIMRSWQQDGGFVYKPNQPFIHLGIKKTKSPGNISHMFATWFRVHTLALISEILTDFNLSYLDWQFNITCSMGWHRKWDRQNHELSLYDAFSEIKTYTFRRLLEGTGTYIKSISK